MGSVGTVTIGDFRLGGAVGEYPTAVLGTLFFSGQKLLVDGERGIFDEAAAKTQIIRCADATGRAGITLFLDVVAETPEAMERYLKFVIRETSLPFLIDSSSDAVRMAGLATAHKYSACNRAVYNSIGTDTGESELELIEENPPAAIVVSAVDPMNFGLESSLSIVRHIKEIVPVRLHDRLLLDIGFLDEASVKISAGIAQEIRRLSGLPVGGAPCNGMYMWDALKARGDAAFQMALAATVGYVGSFGLDFMFVGPLRNVERIAPAVGAVDVYNRYGLQSVDPARILTEHHPMRAMFRQ
ncbi:MAG: hypothetical protein K8I29_16815 [Alphaproteobacteria bacterium]|uniref:Tetrahydromethanopterin S-methyltransferase subunit H n=1 Tax=Candidatus Nitrobium versatile TaxID=2884831 RepID=A0A953M2P4_9BACT|nr:hypothetical protein [Candidatus Nitrobium versatile]